MQGQERWKQPFLKVMLASILQAGYVDIGWREVSSAAFGLPNPKRHIILVAHVASCRLVDSLLFSTVRSN